MSLPEPPSNQAVSSHHQALTREPGDIKRPMTKAEIFAWKAKNCDPRSRWESQEGIHMRAAPPLLPAKRQETDAPGDDSNVLEDSAFWSLEVNMRTLLATSQDFSERLDKEA